jgi:uncharacterized membrane protein YqhA
MPAKPMGLLRYASVVAVFSSFCASLLLFFVGAKKTFTGIYNYLAGVRPSHVPVDLPAEDVAVATIIESLDAFLVALVLMYFGYAIFSLAISDDEKVKKYCPAWLTANKIGDLKETLCHLIIVLLFVLFVRIVWVTLPDLTWELLIIPAAIVLLSLSLKLIEFR